MNKPPKEPAPTRSLQIAGADVPRVVTPAAAKPVKVSRGRPYKTTVAKSTYSHLVLSERVIESLDTSVSQLVEKSASADELRQPVVNKLKEIKGDSNASLYYWKLVFTCTFHLYRHGQEAKQDPKQTDQENQETSSLRSPSVRQMAQAAGMEYHNLKNLFTGHGTVRNLVDYQSFLYENGIDFMQVQYNPRLVDKAYFYLICLRQTSVSQEVLNRLFFQ